MRLTDVRSEIVNALESVLPYPWIVLSRTRQLAEVFTPPAAVIGDVTVSPLSYRASTVRVDVMLLVAVENELDDTYDVDELIDTDEGSSLSLFAASTSAAWIELRVLPEVRVSDEISIGSRYFRGAVWPIELACAD